VTQFFAEHSFLDYANNEIRKPSYRSESGIVFNKTSALITEKVSYNSTKNRHLGTKAGATETPE